MAAPRWARPRRPPPRRVRRSPTTGPGRTSGALLRPVASVIRGAFTAALRRPGAPVVPRLRSCSARTLAGARPVRGRPSWQRPCSLGDGAHRAGRGACYARARSYACSRAPGGKGRRGCARTSGRGGRRSRAGRGLRSPARGTRRAAQLGSRGSDSRGHRECLTSGPLRGHLRGVHSCSATPNSCVSQNAIDVDARERGCRRGPTEAARSKDLIPPTPPLAAVARGRAPLRELQPWQAATEIGQPGQSAGRARYDVVRRGGDHPAAGQRRSGVQGTLRPLRARIVSPSEA